MPPLSKISTFATSADAEAAVSTQVYPRHFYLSESEEGWGTMALKVIGCAGQHQEVPVAFDKRSSRGGLRQRWRASRRRKPLPSPFTLLFLGVRTPPLACSTVPADQGPSTFASRF
jgi:hypothetical protein